MNNKMREEIREKERRIRALLKEKGWQAALLSRQDNFAWLTAGGDSHVAITAETGSASCLVTADEKYLIANNIEVGRIEQEEVGGQGFAFRSFPWYGDKRLAIIHEIVGRGKVVSDDGFGGLAKGADEIARLRFSLTENEVVRYRALGKVAGKLAGEVARKIRPGDTENEVAGRLGGNLLEEGIIPAVILVAADERIRRFRHPIPTNKKIKKCVMVVLCARQGGLIVSLSRLVHFGKFPPDLARRHRAVVEVDATMICRTRPGEKVSKIFREALRAYRRGGFSGEWQLHHQGGATGYATRDYKGSAESREEVMVNQAFAWNPSIAGTKSEDTIIARKQAPEIITTTPSWPMIKAGAVLRADILKK